MLKSTYQVAWTCLGLPCLALASAWLCLSKAPVKEMSLGIRAPESPRPNLRSPLAHIQKLFKEEGLRLENERTRETRGQVQMSKGTLPSLNQTGEGFLLTFETCLQVCLNLLAGLSWLPSYLIWLVPRSNSTLRVDPDIL